MKNFFSGLMLFLFLSGFVSVFAQGSQEEMEAQKKMMEYMTPGDYHKRMAMAVGDWTAKSQFWMAPDTQPMETDGTVKAEMILGGRFLQMKYSSVMMGMPFEGISTDGYDNGRKVFFNIWVDNMGTGVMYSEGVYDENTKQTVYTGKVFDPALGKEVPFREVIQMVDDTHMAMERYFPNSKDGKEYKAMRVEYVKK